MYEIIYHLTDGTQKRNPLGFELVTHVTGVNCITWITGTQPCDTKIWMLRLKFLDILAEIVLGSSPYKGAQLL